MYKRQLLESKLVQPIGSAGESLAAGAIFTMPALFLWAEEGLTEKPGLVEITLIALCGGVLGVLSVSYTHLDVYKRQVLDRYGTYGPWTDPYH